MTSNRDKPLANGVAASESMFWRMEGVRKAFGGIVALDGISLAGRSGSIHAVLGENGAGKSS